MKSMAYEWKGIYGIEGAPPMPVRTIEATTKTLGLTIPRRVVRGAFPMGAQRNPRNRRYNRTTREPTAGLPGRCFDDSRFADDGYQAPTAPMDLLPSTDGPMNADTEPPNQHDAELRPITVLPRPVRYTAIPAVTLVPADQIWGLFDQSLSYVKMSDIQCHSNLNRMIRRSVGLLLRSPHRTCCSDAKICRDVPTLNLRTETSFGVHMPAFGVRWVPVLLD